MESKNEFYEHIILTKKSFEFQSRVIAGEIMQFTRVEIGDGVVSEEDNLYEISSIKNKLTTGDIISIVPDDHTVKLSCTINTEGLTKATIYREIAVFAQIGEEEILYAYINSGEKFDYIVPLANENQRDFTTNVLNLYIVVGDSANIDITLNNTVIVENSININMLDNSVKEYIDKRIEDYLAKYVPENNSKFELIREDDNNYIGLIKGEDLEQDDENDFVLNL